MMMITIIMVMIMMNMIIAMMTTIFSDGIPTESVTMILMTGIGNKLKWDSEDPPPFLISLLMVPRTNNLNF